MSKVLTFNYTTELILPYPFKLSGKTEELKRFDKVISIIRCGNGGRFYLCASQRGCRFIVNSCYQVVAKKCVTCKRMLIPKSFSFDRGSKFNLQNSCRECDYISSNSWQRNNPDKRKLQCRRYNKKYPDKSRKRLRAWRENNPQKALQRDTRQRASRNACDTDEFFLETFLASKQRCEVTGSVDVTVEHIMPVSVAKWGNTAGNLMWLNSSLNFSKGAKNVFVWLHELTYHDLQRLLPENYLPESIEVFRENYLKVLKIKAAERGLSFSEYSEIYEGHFLQTQ